LGAAAEIAQAPRPLSYASRVADRVFLLSPASCAGARGQLLLRAEASFDLALRLRSEGVALGEVFSFVSALYFRGKLSYAQCFAAPPPNAPGVLVITTNRGLVPPDTAIGLADLRAFARVSIDADNRTYTRPLREAAVALRARLTPGTEVVLLGSIATPKYVDVLLETFGKSLLFPADFVGRGDMSRGGLLLRAAKAGRELGYQPIDGAVRHGQRAPRLGPAPG
jgi:hypothetical protein